MNDILELIKSRRSIRKYTPESPPIEQILRCIEAALHAPSARNSQPWSFIIVKDRITIEKLSQVQPYTEFLKRAPYVVVALADEKRSNHWLEDLGCAIMCLLLEAHSLGLGACWGAVYHPENKERERYVREILDIPPQLRIIACIGIGYPDEVPAPKRVKSLDEAILKVV